MKTHVWALLLPLALAACSQPRTPLPVDRVGRPTPAVSPAAALLSPQRIVIEGAAGWETMPLAEALRRRAVTPSDHARVDAILASGAALDDPIPVARLTRPGITVGQYQAGTAYLLDVFPTTRPPEAFQLSVTAELSGGAGASVGLSLELRDRSAMQTGDVGQLLITLMDPGTDTSAQLSVLTRGSRPGDAFDVVASAPLARRDWRGPHRIELEYTPGQLIVTLDDEPTVTAPVRLDRPAGPVYIGAFASTPTMGVTLLDLTFDSP